MQAFRETTYPPECDYENISPDKKNRQECEKNTSGLENVMFSPFHPANS